MIFYIDICCHRYFLAIFVCGAASRAIFLVKQVFVYWSPLCGKPYSIRVLSNCEKFWLVTGHFWLVTCLVTPDFSSANSTICQTKKSQMTKFGYKKGRNIHPILLFSPWSYLICIDILWMITSTNISSKRVDL